ncbi:hypothetical protein PHLGIDRAFT_213818 [Phlebiopsis gigantea 11061_1 CR5-6]|uniref:Uncharacterized protein n=1 Tax=Phlebiopsis gigantea (strain 11061_1 CR5-6) TaxID=745531 RepID=A0A0C3S6B6_PHLG1|nr:hypothetical protein PHLGIDRAFT_213818 [Phlebiopsis gigantea 11061_1 CR5-6]
MSPASPRYSPTSPASPSSPKYCKSRSPIVTQIANVSSQRPPLPPILPLLPHILLRHRRTARRRPSGRLRALPRTARATTARTLTQRRRRGLRASPSGSFVASPSPHFDSFALDIHQRYHILFSSV